MQPPLIVYYYYYYRYYVVVITRRVSNKKKKKSFPLAPDARGISHPGERTHLAHTRVVDASRISITIGQRCGRVIIFPRCRSTALVARYLHFVSLHFSLSGTCCIFFFPDHRKKQISVYRSISRRARVFNSGLPIFFKRTRVFNECM